MEDLSSLLQYGSSAKTGEDGAGVPVLRMGNIVGGRLIFEPLKYLPHQHAEFPTLLLEPGDVLFNRTNSPELVGKSAVYLHEHPSPCSFASYLIRIRFERYEPALFAAYMNSGFGRAWIRTCVTQQVGQANVSGGKLKELELPVPPLNEQRRIVATLAAVQARSRRAREALDAVPPLLEKLRQSILASAFRGDLTKDWRAQHPDVEPATELLKRIRLERRKKWEAAELARMTAKGKVPTTDGWRERYKEGLSANRNAAPLPSGWAASSIDSVGELLLGRRRAGEEYVEGVEGRVLRPYVRVANVKEDRLELTDVLQMPFNAAELMLYRLEVGDIILSEGQSAELVGQSATYEGGYDDLCIQATVHRFRALATATTSAFAQLVFLHHLHAGVFMSAAALTTNIAHLTSERLKPLPFPLPPLEEQALIVVRARRALTSVRLLEAELAVLKKKRGALERAVLAKAFRGELVPQDPSDEPADVMLARASARSASPVATAAKAVRRRGPARGVEDASGG